MTHATAPALVANQTPKPFGTLSGVYLRPGRLSDVDALYGLAEQTGPGFTSLVTDRDLLASRLAVAEESFASHQLTNSYADYILIAEKPYSGEVVGCSTIKAADGPRPDFLNYHLERAVDGTATHLLATDALADAAEVGSLFAAPSARGTGAGRLLAQGRYMLMAANPDRFPPMVMAELRGLGSDEDEPALWKCLGQKLYKMSFATADEKVGSGDTAFMIEGTPRTPIPLTDLSMEAIAALGACHPDGEPALRLLRREGFEDIDIVDLFDGGLIVATPVKNLRTLKESQRLSISPAAHLTNTERLLISNDRVHDFRCTIADVAVEGDKILAPATVLSCLNLTAGDNARVMTP